jgi:hypothetical protein
MDLAQFLILQEHLLNNFGWFLRWWLILFAVAGIALAVFIFALQVVSTWLNKNSR